MSAQQPTVYLIRHCQAALNGNPGRIRGRQNESPPTELGLKQARLLGGWFLDELIVPDRVDTSPALRARLTARSSLLAMGLLTRPRICDDLQEMGQGDATNMPRDEVYTEAVIAERERLLKDFKLPGGESMNDVAARMLHWLGAVPPEGITFAYTHGVATRCLVGTMENWDRDKIYQTETPNTSFTTLVHTGVKWKLGELAAVPHLPPELVTN